MKIANAPRVRTASLLPWLLVLAGAGSARADIFWVGAVSDDIFDEANWDLSNSTVTLVDPNVTIADNVVIVDAPVPIDIFVVGQQGRFQVGNGFLVTVDNSTLFTSSNDGLSGEPGTIPGNGPRALVIDGGDVATFFITNGLHMIIDEQSSSHLAGGATPINGATIDLTAGALLACTDETVTDFINEHIQKITVEGAPAVVDVNVTVVSDGGAGCLVEVILPPIGSAYCFGDGSGTPCPCGNAGTSGNGCANGSFAEGAHLEASGEIDGVLLTLTQGTPGEPVLFFQGVNAVNGGAGVLFGDGLRCAGGSLVRLGVESMDANGESTLSGTIQRNGGGAAPGETRYYQGWYRNPTGSPCGFTFNLSNGVQVDY